MLLKEYSLFSPTLFESQGSPMSDEPFLRYNTVPILLSIAYSKENFIDTDRTIFS